MSTKQNLTIRQGTTIKFEFQLFDAEQIALNDTSGYTANAQMRQSWEGNTTYVFDTSIVDGILSIEMTANASALIPANNYYYQVDTTVANTTNPLVDGMITVLPRF